MTGMSLMAATAAVFLSLGAPLYAQGGGGGGMGHSAMGGGPGGSMGGGLGDGGLGDGGLGDGGPLGSGNAGLNTEPRGSTHDRGTPSSSLEGSTNSALGARAHDAFTRTPTNEVSTRHLSNASLTAQTHSHLRSNARRSRRTAKTHHRHHNTRIAQGATHAARPSHASITATTHAAVGSNASH
jgi:hypothetical protein